MSVMYTAKVEVTGGRTGSARSEDGQLDAPLAFPGAMGGDGRGTNPEQLFAAAHAACFATTIAFVAKNEGSPIAPVNVTSEVDVSHADGRFSLAARLYVHRGDVDLACLEDLVEKAKAACPYSRMAHATLPTTVTIVG